MECDTPISAGFGWQYPSDSIDVIECAGLAFNTNTASRTNAAVNTIGESSIAAVRGEQPGEGDGFGGDKENPSAAPTGSAGWNPLCTWVRGVDSTTTCGTDRVGTTRTTAR